MNTKFPVLSVVSLLLRSVGWVVVVSAVIYLVKTAGIEPHQAGHQWGPGNTMSLLAGGAASLLGLIIVAIGEAIGVLFAIEENTRASHRPDTGTATILALAIVCFGSIASADWIPREEADKQAEQALGAVAKAEQAYFGKHHAYASCYYTEDCSSKLAIPRPVEGVNIMFTWQAGFIGTAISQFGTGRIFTKVLAAKRDASTSLPEENVTQPTIIKEGEIRVAEGAPVEMGIGTKTTWGGEGGAPGQFKGPEGITLDSKGNLYVADTGNHRIQKLSPKGDVLTVWGGTKGTEPGQFKEPSSIAIDAYDRLYVADTWNQRVQVFTSEGKYQIEFGGQFYGPRGIAVGPTGKIFVADSGGDRIRRFSAEGVEETNWGGQGNAPGRFKEPVGVATDGEGRVYVCDNGNGRLQIFDGDGQLQGSFPVEGWESKAFSLPYVTIAPGGTIWVTVPLGQAVRAYKRNGTIIHEISGGEVPSAIFERPMGVAFGVADHKLIFTDRENRIVLIHLRSGASE